MFGEIFSRRVFIGKKTFWQWMAVRLALTMAKHSAIQNPTFAPISSMLPISKNTLSLSFKTCLQELPRNSFISQPCIGSKKDEDEQHNIQASGSFNIFRILR